MVETPLVNTPSKAESLLHSQEQEASGIGPYVNANKTEYMYFQQKGVISTLSGEPLKLLDQFKYLSRNV